MDRATLTALGFSVLMALMVIAFILDAVSQFIVFGVYQAPPYLIEFCRLALQSALGATAFAGLREARRVYREKRKKTSTEHTSLPPTKPADGDGRSS